MKTFLQEVVDAIKKQEDAISELILILPSIRAGLFLKELIKETYANQTLFAPEVISIEAVSYTHLTLPTKRIV